MPLARPCLTCGVPTANGTRCPAHTHERKAARNAETPRAKAAVDAHVAAHGWLCPGDDAHAPHPCTDLTAEHTEARGSAPTWPDAPMTVLCRSGNSARGAR